MLAPNVIIPFIGTHAGIPAGFTRVTELDDKYAVGASDAAEPATTGGNASHTHTSTAHTHTTADHHASHSMGQTSQAPDSADGSGDSETISKAEHSHGGGSLSTTTGTANDSVTYGAASNDPEYFTVIFIKAGGYKAVPQNGMIFTEATTRPGFTYHSASSTKYLKGASTGADSSGTGGTFNNVHDVTHTHTGSHNHTGQTANGNSSAGGTGGEGNNSTITHYHTFTSPASSDSLNTGDITSLDQLNATGGDIEPPFTTLNTYYNNGASNLGLIPNDIAMWDGALADIPIGWRICDGTNSTPDMRDQFLKNTDLEEASTTGGSATHAHPTAGSHSHTVTGTHTHAAVGTGSASASTNAGTGNQTNRSNQSHNHTTAVSGTSSVTYGSDTTTPDSSDNTPEYYTVLFIQFQYLPFGNAIMGLI